MAANAPPIIPGSSGGAAYELIYKANIGRKWIYEGSDWRMVKAAGALTAMANAAVVSAEVAGVPSYSASTTVVAGDRTFVGVCATGQTDLAAGDYFMVQCTGVALMITEAAVLINALLSTSGTAKRVVTTILTDNGLVGYAKVAGGIGAVIPVQLVAR